MGYRDSLAPAPARIAELRAEGERRKTQVLPGFWRPPETSALAPLVLTMDKITSPMLAAASLDALVSLEARFEQRFELLRRKLHEERYLRGPG